MRYRKVYDTRAKAQVQLQYKDPPGSTIVLDFPLVYARQSWNLPGVLQQLLTTTRPPLDPGEQELFRALQRAAQQDLVLRRFREGDRVTLDLTSGRGTLTWELNELGWNVIQ